MDILLLGQMLQALLVRCGQLGSVLLFVIHMSVLQQKESFKLFFFFKGQINKYFNKN